MKRCKKQLMGLPNELLVDIFLRMAAETVCRTKLACKTFLNIIDDPSFVRQHTLSLLATKNNHGVPQLVCLTQHTGEQEGMKEKSTPLATLKSLRYEGDLITKGETLYTCSMSGLGRSIFTIDFVFYNLICMSCGQDGRCWLINPLRKEVLTLPNDNIVDKVSDYGDDFTLVINHGMGYDDITDTYKIVRVSRFFKYDIDRNDWVNVVVVHILVLGTNIWREIPSTPLPLDFESVSSICAHGDMHWFTDRWERGKTKEFIVSFDFRKEEFSWTYPPSGLRGPEDMDYNLHLLTLSGSMAITENYPSKGGGTQVGIWVMNDYAKKEWTKMYDLNFDKLPRFYLDSAICEEWEHGIFFNEIISPFIVWFYFLDLRYASLKICPLQNKKDIYIKRYTRSLISLRDFGPSGYKRINDEPNL